MEYLDVSVITEPFTAMNCYFYFVQFFFWFVGKIALIANVSLHSLTLFTQNGQNSTLWSFHHSECTRIKLKMNVK